jgi:hypothetical protein
MGAQARGVLPRDHPFLQDLGDMAQLVRVVKAKRQGYAHQCGWVGLGLLV